MQRLPWCPYVLSCSCSCGGNREMSILSLRKWKLLGNSKCTAACELSSGCCIWCTKESRTVSHLVCCITSPWFRASHDVTFIGLFCRQIYVLNKSWRALVYCVIFSYISAECVHWWVTVKVLLNQQRNCGSESETRCHHVALAQLTLSGNKKPDDLELQSQGVNGVWELLEIGTVGGKWRENVRELSVFVKVSI